LKTDRHAIRDAGWRVQGPGAPDEDRRNGFDRGGWQAPYADPWTWPAILSIYERADALLLGRVTLQIWHGYWPHHDAGDAVSHGITCSAPDHIDRLPKEWAPRSRSEHPRHDGVADQRLTTAWVGGTRPPPPRVR
jgi:hypothetical protein